MNFKSYHLFVCLVFASACVAQAQTGDMRFLTPSTEEQMQIDAAAAARRYVASLPVVESNSAISDRVRAITINDRGRRCVIEVTYNGSNKYKDLPSGWLVSKDGCLALQ